MNLTYKRPYCKSCRLIWGKSSIGRVLNCNQCGQPLALKSFNPWLKAFIGIAIIVGGLATMSILGFPMYWIGGLLFGPMFIFNGVKQWFKIKRLDRKVEQHSSSERFVAGGILICRKCGQKNRVSNHSRKFRPICGKCRAPLSVSMVAVLTRQAQRFRPAWIGACVILAVIVLPAVANKSRPRSPVASQNAYRLPIVAPESRPSRVLPHITVQPTEHRPPPMNRHLPNGTVIRSAALGGLGQLEINNGLSWDAVAKLIDTQTDRSIAYFYISAGAVYALPRIPDGNYRLLFAVGEDWDSAKRFFSRPKGVSEFNKKLLFKTRQRYEGDGVYQEYSVMQMTLHPVPQGNARTHKVSVTEFEKY